MFLFPAGKEFVNTFHTTFGYRNPTGTDILQDATSFLQLLIQGDDLFRQTRFFHNRIDRINFYYPRIVTADNLRDIRIRLQFGCRYFTMPCRQSLIKMPQDTKCQA